MQAVVIGRQLACDKGQLVKDYRHKGKRTLGPKQAGWHRRSRKFDINCIPVQYVLYSCTAQLWSTTQLGKRAIMTTERGSSRGGLNVLINNMALW